MQSKHIAATLCLVMGSQNQSIRTSPLGSYVAAIASDKTSKTGAIAHIMLPCNSPLK